MNDALSKKKWRLCAVFFVMDAFVPRTAQQASTQWRGEVSAPSLVQTIIVSRVKKR